MKKLINEGVDPEKASLEKIIRNWANLKKIWHTCKFLGGCNKAIRSDELCKDHQPIKAKKSDRRGSSGAGVRGVEVKVTGGVCNPCYKKPGATAARKTAMVEKKEAQGVCSTPGCTGIIHNGCGKCMRCLYY